MNIHLQDANVEQDGRAAQDGVGMPLVSVVIPCHNHAHFLAEAIESVRAQSYPCVEIIVVDDGSTDATTAVASAAGVCVIRQENGGLSAARNAGLRASRGAFLVFLDADDRLLPNALEIGLTTLEGEPRAAFVFGGYRNVDRAGMPLGEVVPPVPCDEDSYLALLRTNVIGMHGTVMYRRYVLEEIAGFDPSLRRCEDYDLYLRLARTHPVAAHGEIVAEYRRHDGNMSRDAEGMLAHALIVLRRQRPHVRHDARLRVALRSGIRTWRSYYGGQLIGEAAAAVRQRDWVSAGRLGIRVMRRHPAGAFASLGRAILRTVHGENRARPGAANGAVPRTERAPGRPLNEGVFDER